MSLTNFDTAGATSLHTTVEDLQLWDENFYHPRVGGPELIQQMLERGKLNSGELQDYASGIVIGTYKGLPTVEHGGADAGYRSDMIRFPDQHFSDCGALQFRRCKSERVGAPGGRHPSRPGPQGL